MSAEAIKPDPIALAKRWGNLRGVLESRHARVGWLHPIVMTHATDTMPDLDAALTMARSRWATNVLVLSRSPRAIEAEMAAIEEQFPPEQQPLLRQRANTQELVRSRRERVTWLSPIANTTPDEDAAPLDAALTTARASWARSLLDRAKTPEDLEAELQAIDVQLSPPTTTASEQPLPFSVSARRVPVREATDLDAVTEVAGGKIAPVERLTTVPQSMVIDNNPGGGIVINRKGEDPRDVRMTPEQKILLDFLAEQPGVPHRGSVFMEHAKSQGIDLRSFEKIFQDMRFALDGSLWSVITFERNVMNRPDGVTLLMDQVVITEGTNPPRIITAPWVEQPQPPKVAGEPGPNSEMNKAQVVYYVDHGEDVTTVTVVHSDGPQTTSFSNTAKSNGKSVADYILEPRRRGKPITNTDVLTAVGNPNPDGKVPFKATVAYVKKKLRQIARTEVFDTTHAADHSSFIFQGIVVFGEPGSAPLPNLSDTSPTEAIRYAEFVDGKKALYVDWQPDVTIVTALSAGAPRRAEYRDNPTTKSKTMVDYILRNPDRIRSDEIAPAAEVQGSQLPFPVQFFGVKRSLKRLAGGAELFETDDQTRVKTFRMNAVVIPVGTAGQTAPTMPVDGTRIESSAHTETDKSLPLMRLFLGNNTVTFGKHNDYDKQIRDTTKALLLYFKDHKGEHIPIEVLEQILIEQGVQNPFAGSAMKSILVQAEKYFEPDTYFTVHRKPTRAGKENVILGYTFNGELQVEEGSYRNARTRRPATSPSGAGRTTPKAPTALPDELADAVYDFTTIFDPVKRYDRPQKYPGGVPVIPLSGIIPSDYVDLLPDFSTHFDPVSRHPKPDSHPGGEPATPLSGILPPDYVDLLPDALTVFVGSPAESLMTAGPDFQGFVFDGLAGALPLNKDMPLPPQIANLDGQTEAEAVKLEPIKFVETIDGQQVLYVDRDEDTTTIISVVNSKLIIVPYTDTLAVKKRKIIDHMLAHPNNIHLGTLPKNLYTPGSKTPFSNQITNVRKGLSQQFGLQLFEKDPDGTSHRALRLNAKVIMIDHASRPDLQAEPAAGKEQEVINPNRIPQSLIVYRGSSGVDGKMRRGNETRDVSFSTQEATLLALLAQRTGVTISAQDLRDEAVTAGLSIRFFWDKLRSLQYKLEEGWPDMSALQITRDELQGHTITLLMDRVEIRTRRGEPIVYTAPWISEPEAGVTETEKATRDAVHSNRRQTAPSPSRSRTRRTTTKKPHSPTRRIASVAPERQAPPAARPVAPASQETASEAENPEEQSDIFVDLDGEVLLVTVGANPVRRISGAGVRSVVEPLLRRAGEPILKNEVGKSFVGNLKSMTTALTTARAIFNSDEELGTILTVTVVHHGWPIGSQSTYELAASVTFSDKYLAQFPLEETQQSEPIDFFGTQTSREKPVVEVVARAEGDMQSHVWTVEEEQQVSRVIAGFGYGSEQTASLLYLANIIWPDQEITELSAHQLNIVLRTVNKARYKIRGQKERVITAAYNPDIIRGYYFGQAVETDEDETTATLPPDFPDNATPTSLGMTFGELKKSQEVKNVITGIRKNIEKVSTLVEIANMIWPDEKITELDEAQLDAVHIIAWAAQAKVKSGTGKRPLLAAHRPELLGYYFDQPKSSATVERAPKSENIVFLERDELADTAEAESAKERRVGLPTVGIFVNQSDHGPYLEVQSYTNWKQDRHPSLLDDKVLIKLFAYLGLQPNQRIDEATLRNVVRDELSQPDSLSFSEHMAKLKRRVEGHIPGGLISVREDPSPSYELKANVQLYEGQPDTAGTKRVEPSVLYQLLKPYF